MTTSRRSAALAACLAVAALGACTPDDPAELMSSARDYMARSDYPAASIQARNAVKAQPDNAVARRRAARLAPDRADIRLNYAKGLLQDALMRARLNRGGTV